jgi:hypothetical protein
MMLKTFVIRYYGNNDAKAYAAGFETRLFGELVKMLKAGSASALCEQKKI